MVVFSFHPKLRGVFILSLKTLFEGGSRVANSPNVRRDKFLIHKENHQRHTNMKKKNIYEIAKTHLVQTKILWTGKSSFCSPVGNKPKNHFKINPGLNFRVKKKQNYSCFK